MQTFGMSHIRSAGRMRRALQHAGHDALAASCSFYDPDDTLGPRVNTADGTCILGGKDIDANVVIDDDNTQRLCACTSEYRKPDSVTIGYYVSEAGRIGIDARCSRVCWLELNQACHATPEFHGDAAAVNKALAASDEKYCAGVTEDSSLLMTSYDRRSADCTLPVTSTVANCGSEPSESETSVCCCGSREFCDQDQAEPAFTFTERVCANDCQQTASLSCPSGTAIEITDAFYGRLSGYVMER